MHGTNVQSVIVSETVTIIAVCIESRDLAEIAGALTLITTNNVDMAIGELSPVSSDRITRSLADANWRSRISSVLGNPNIIQLSDLFIQRCHRCVPSDASNPLMDETWLNRVQTAFFHDEALQMIARAIVGAIPIPKAISEPRPKVEAPKPAPVIREVPAPKRTRAVRRLAVAAAAPAPSTPALHDAMAAFVTHLERLQKAQQVADAFMMHYNAQQARKAAEQPFALLPEQPQIVATPTPKIEALASPSIAVPTPRRRQRPVMRASVLQSPSRNRVACRSRTLLQRAITAPTHSPHERRSIPAPLGHVPLAMRRPDAQPP